jgi:uncharacterized protein (DUF302 family)
MTDQPSAFTEHSSPLDFEQTVERLTQAIEKAGMTIFARIDHAANARTVGMQMPAATVVIYGNAKGGTPIMLANPLAALDLPLRVLVREAADGTTKIVFHPIADLLAPAGVPTDVAGRLTPAQALLAASVTP